MTRALAVTVLATVVGCKDKQASSSGAAGSAMSATSTADAGLAPTIDWPACEAALKQAAAAPPAARAQLVIGGCKVCGDWDPILRWNTPVTSGGPKREAIEAAMVGCNAFCNGDAKHKFMGTLDDARGSSIRTPWRQLATICRDQIRAVPDQRFMGATYFALDRIARAVFARGGEAAELTSKLEFPLPPVTQIGTGLMLPDANRRAPAAPDWLQITVLADGVFVGRLPRAKLGAAGIVVDLDTDGYPGKRVALEAINAELVKHIRPAGESAVILLAPATMPARTLIPLLAQTGTFAPTYLAVAAPESMHGWPLIARIPIELLPAASSERGDPSHLSVRPTMTVQELATELAHRSATKDRIGIIAQ